MLIGQPTQPEVDLPQMTKEQNRAAATPEATGVEPETRVSFSFRSRTEETGMGGEEYLGQIIQGQKGPLGVGGRPACMDGVRRRQTTWGGLSLKKNSLITHVPKRHGGPTGKPITAWQGTTWLQRH